MHLWEIDHPYHCTGSNYYSNEPASLTVTPIIRNGELKLYFIAQRKGFHIEHVIEVCRNDAPAIEAYLQEKWNYLQKLWAPIS